MFFSKLNHLISQHTTDLTLQQKREMELHQLLEAGSKVHLIIISHILLGTIAVIAMKNHVPQSIILGWVLFVLVSILMRTAIILTHKKATLETLTKWKMYFIAASFFSGIVWGIGGLLLNLYASDLHYGISAFILGGMAAGSIALNTAIGWNYPAFMIPMLLPLTIYHFLFNDTPHILMASMVIVFILVLSMFSIKFRQLQFEKYVSLLLSQDSLEKFRISEQRLKDITSSMGEGVFVIDKDGLLNFMNKEGEHLLGWKFTELKHSDIDSKIHLHQDGVYHSCLIKKAAMEGETRHSDNEIFIRRNGEEFPVSLTAAPLHSNDEISGSVIIFQDITTQKELEEKLKTMALHDALTGLYNRGSFDVRLRDEITRSARYGRTLSLLMLDIDLFKEVNDTYGHQAGDEVLRRVAELILSSVRKSDYCARYGGEEFAVILPETDEDKAFELAERIRINIEKNAFILSDNTVVHCTISIGVSTYAEGSITPEQKLIEDADNGLYQAKENGRNQVQILHNRI